MKVYDYNTHYKKFSTLTNRLKKRKYYMYKLIIFGNIRYVKRAYLFFLTAL